MPNPKPQWSIQHDFPSSKSLGRPPAAAGAPAALAPPNSTAAVLAETAKAVGPFAAGADGDPHTSLRGDLSLNCRNSTTVDDHSELDLHAKAIVGVTRSPMGYDDHAPVAIIECAGKGRTDNGEVSKHQNKTSESRADLLIHHNTSRHWQLAIEINVKPRKS